MFLSCSPTAVGPVLAIEEIVASGLCIGCGLCESVAGPDVISMRMLPEGVERPVALAPVPPDALASVNRWCPGLHVEVDAASENDDPMWGPVRLLARGHAADPRVRFEAATGGVLTSLAQYALEGGRVEQVLHVGPRADDPLRWEARISTTPAEVLAASGSRYGPAAPLTGLLDVLASERMTAVVAKPCDIAAVRNVIREQEQSNIAYLLTMACGGASTMHKTWALLDDWSVDRSDVASIRYRGFGNPGPTTVVGNDGSRHDTTYAELWEDEGTWDLQWRCKVCADGMGEVADIVSLDCWPGGGPTGEDDGFNGIITRTDAGEELFSAAVAAGSIVLVETDLPAAETLENWQPHQSRRKRAVPQRLAAMMAEGLPATTYVGNNLANFTTGEVDEGTLVRLRRRT